ncbi:MAG: phage Gp19/Gp15/Gp42 family protein [Acidipropionibacterium jensenii]|nr:phage Gp19/Gp15/Gp42 family protein [Acidipropionibacterium jensenii]
MAVEAPFATVSDLEARWRTLTADEKARAQVLIDDASDKITTTCTGWVDASEATLRRITCAMVKRAMATPAGADGADVSSLQQGAGPYQATVQFSNPSGDLYLTKAEKVDLGDGKQHAFEVDLLADRSVT